MNLDSYKQDSKHHFEKQIQAQMDELHDGLKVNMREVRQAKEDMARSIEQVRIRQDENERVFRAKWE